MEEFRNRIEKPDADFADGTRINAEVLGEASMATEYLKNSGLTEKLINVYYSLYNELGYGFSRECLPKGFCINAEGARKCVPRASSHSRNVSRHRNGEFLADLLVDNRVL